MSRLKQFFGNYAAPFFLGILAGIVQHPLATLVFGLVAVITATVMAIKKEPTKMKKVGGGIITFILAIFLFLLSTNVTTKKFERFEAKKVQQVTQEVIEQK
jgi:high-affinity nickel permease